MGMTDHCCTISPTPVKQRLDYQITIFMNTCFSIRMPSARPIDSCGIFSPAFLRLRGEVTPNHLSQKTPHRFAPVMREMSLRPKNCSKQFLKTIKNPPKQPSGLTGSGKTFPFQIRPVK